MERPFHGLRRRESDHLDQTLRVWQPSLAHFMGRTNAATRSFGTTRFTSNKYSSHMPRPISLLFLLALLPACSSRVIEGDPLSLEAARPPRSAATLQELLPWATATSPKPSPLETKTTEGEFVIAYEILEGPNSGGVMLVTRAKGLTPTSWLITRRIEGDADALEERAQALDPADGSLVLSHSLNIERGVRVEMNPAPVTVPARIEPGQTLSREMRIRLPLLDNPKRLREKGTAISEITYVGDQRIRTADGAYETKHLREVFTSRFAAATAVRTTDRWFAPGKGLVAERWSEEVSVLGVVIERTKFAMRILIPESHLNRAQSAEITSPRPAETTP